ncbi:MULTISPECIES: anthranilate synthase component II [Fusobacterium]|uniref:anthranilate synthase component II n=1 Tax=Fusobacterium TaxID=848 RepID=UPI0025C14F2E|nr:aminodeoxychorismate/anthranilate synthase component II [Fusobacterium sp.]MDD7391955.1 aminodeoxychorismate/anthranilate synthase component II [Fusobacteriaceae bacterium]MDY5712696.1 aminodeoxychorismate/anthranilate synthase component II [Fusobacterium gastrosuis]MCI5724812.1 aminodeoxychorismate/anthranilate synthase component II [Fusobacterium sp.]MDD7411576.1 aminodeoxychorismate/anthranilate synthase component II [Fusobacteriaceae bacterium]MDY5795361.1 aminodeoxychorismate/anthranil
MFLMIDNYDSFVYNLVSYFMEENIEMDIVRNDFVNLDEIETKITEKKLEGIIISPGPKSPKDCGLCGEIVEKFYKKIPIFGVCLGHQIIGHVFGANVTKANKAMHGKVESVINNGKNIFKDLPKEVNVTRYHSLVIKEYLPDDFEIDAQTKDNIIMAISHKFYPLYGVQFHPEAVLTEYGHEMVRNFITLAKEWREQNAK